MFKFHTNRAIYTLQQSALNIEKQPVIPILIFIDHLEYNLNRRYQNFVLGIHGISAT